MRKLLYAVFIVISVVSMPILSVASNAAILGNDEMAIMYGGQCGNGLGGECNNWESCLSWTGWVAYRKCTGGPFEPWHCEDGVCHICIFDVDCCGY